MEPNQRSVTVLLLNFNQAKYIHDAWHSLRAQTVQPHQVLVIDDGSEDLDLEIIKPLVSSGDLPAQLIHDGENHGHTARMNEALEVTTGEFFMLLSADDWLEPTAIEHLSNGFTPEIDVVWGNLSVVNEDGSSRGYVRPRQNWQGKIARKYLSGGNVFQDMLQVNSFVTGGMSLLRVEAVKKAGGWDRNVTTEDFDFWLRVGQNSLFKYVDEVVGYYRQVPNSKSRNDDHKLFDQATIFAKHTGQSREIDKGMAYLASMRWALAVARRKKIPGVSLREMAHIMDINVWLLYRELPRAIYNPLWGSTKAYFARRNSR